jgi:ABC-type multidrug transport system ATPase subunit
VLQAEKVFKRYGKRIVLDSISFEIQEGEALALWGPNGAGKTTLIKAMLGLIDYQGSLRIAGNEVRQSGKLTRSRIGYVPQEAVYYDMSVQTTMKFYARLKNVDPHRIHGIINELGLTEHTDKSVAALSGGLKQRLALGIALLSDPPILLLDEPTANLDTQGRRDYLALLGALRREQKTILFASHRVEEVEAQADRVLVLEAGRITQDLNPADLRLRLAPHVEITLWVGEDQRPNALRALQEGGLQARLNGRGTVVVQVKSHEKLHPIQLLAEQGITVLDFEIERGRLWS